MDISLQSIILELQRFWADEGCIILQPYDKEMGAATFHPATTLYALGNRPWSAAFAQPCRRPQDGRYGDNPNRFQKFTQFQVILKPSPKDIQATVLRSFDAIGLDTKNHDIRFVEDDWAGPTLGAAGVGWEVWFDGMEILQFTYFQQVGGIPCTVVPVELAYGVERIAMCVQKKDSAFDLALNPPGQPNSQTFRDACLQAEFEFSTYYFDVAPVPEVLDHFTKALDLGALLVKDQLVFPAYEHCIAASHLFNILDARGAIGVSQRALFIQKIRTLAGQCCRAFLDKEAHA